MVYKQSVDYLQAVYNNPRILCRKLLEHTNRYRKKLFIKKFGEMTDVLEKDWDNLIILDACRYDFFEKTNKICGELTKIASKGSHSSEFITESFIGNDLSDTVYVTSNPHAEKISDDVFYRVIKTYTKDSIDNKNDYSGTAPEIVTEKAINALNEYKNKRLIIHYMQPHSPFLGEYASRLREKLKNNHGLSFERTDNINSDWSDSESLADLRMAEKQDYISIYQLMAVYKGNLRLVLDYVQDLLSQVQGKSVITSDHGELLGTTSSYIYNKIPCMNMHGHPKNTYLPELRFVPWLEVEGYGERRKITKEDPVGVDSAEESTIEDQLKALGYAQ